MLACWALPPACRPTPKQHSCRKRSVCAAAAVGRDGSNSAVVLGAGIAGLSIAQVLARHFDSVTVLERDPIVHTNEAIMQDRPGVPQFQQPHGLLLGGLRALCDIFGPGFEAALVAAGGVRVDWGLDCELADFGVSFARAPSPLRTVCGSRALFEHVCRSLALANSNVMLRDGCPATNLVWDGDKAAVAGVEVRGGEAVAADLVIDASGRSSRLGQWLAEAGWEAPRELVVDAKVGYATRIYRCPEDYSGPKAVLCGTRPAGTRSGLLAPIEGGRWNVILGGYCGDHPPTDEEGFLAFARTLPAPSLAAAMAAAEPLSPIRRYGATQNVRRAWEEVALPERLGVMGDAVCALNPIYGQGMTVAAKECLVLAELLEERLGAAGASSATSGRGAALEVFSRELQRAVAATVNGPWQLATGEDAAFPATESNVPVAAQPPLLAAYFQRLAEAASRDAGVCAQFCSVLQMAEEPAVLFQPGLVAQVLEGEPDMAHQVLELVGGGAQ